VVPVLSATAGTTVGDTEAAGSAVAILAGDGLAVEAGATGVFSMGAGTLASSASVGASKPDALYKTGSCGALPKDTITLETGGNEAAISAVRDNCTEAAEPTALRLCIA